AYLAEIAARNADTAPQPMQQGGGEVAMEAWNAALNDAGELRSNAPDERYARRAANVESWIKANRPAPPSAPVGVEDIAVELEEFANCPGRVLTLAGKLRALAQQPAAVDEACESAAEDCGPVAHYDSDGV